MDKEQSRVLEFLIRNRREVVPIGAIENGLGMDRQKVFYNLTVLEKNGLVSIRWSQSGRNMKDVTLKEQAQETFDQSVKFDADAGMNLDDVLQTLDELKKSIADLEQKIQNNGKGLLKKVGTAADWIIKLSQLQSAVKQFESFFK